MSTATELLRRMIGYLDYSNKEADAFAVEVEAFLDEAFFTAEKEAEPFGYVSHHKVEGPFKWQFTKELAEVYPDTALSITPLYLHPPRPEPAKKPMTNDEIEEVASRLKDARMSWGFIEGVRFAEKHHGIGGSDE